MITNSKPELGFISIDIERTGKDLKNGDTFAFGIADASVDAVGAFQVYSNHVCLNLNKPSDQEWSQKWLEKNYEQRCFDEFWSKNLHILDKLQDPDQVQLVSTEKEFATRINVLLEEAESRYQDTWIVIDCPLFDPVFVSELLMKYGFMPINYTRAGRYRSSWEIDSYCAGKAGCAPEDWRSTEAFKKSALQPLYIEKVEHDHHPENDAKSILVTALAARKYQQVHETKRPRSP